MTPLSPPPPDQLATEKQQRLDELLDRNSEGTIGPNERAELEALVEAAEKLMVANARRLAEFSRNAAGAPTAAVPVTVWVKPAHAES